MRPGRIRGPVSISLIVGQAAVRMGGKHGRPGRFEGVPFSRQFILRSSFALYARKERKAREIGAQITADLLAAAFCVRLADSGDRISDSDVGRMAGKGHGGAA